MAYESTADEIFYGGAAGGGKTDLLLGLSLTKHQRSIIFRREYPQLAEIVDRSRQVVGDLGKYNEQKKRWTLKDKRILEFGAVQRDADVRDFQGRAHDLKAFDELPNFTEFQYRFLIGWARTTRPNQPVQIVGAGNPPTSSDGEWVIRRWRPWIDEQHPKPARPGELRWFAVIDGEDVEVEGDTPFVRNGEMIHPKSRTFIPAKLADNPYLMAQGYAATLQALPEPLRSQMMGSFLAGIGTDPWQIIPTEWVRLAQQRWEECPQTDTPLSAMGVDVARGGKDKTVIAKRYGNWFAPLLKYPGADTPNGTATAGLVIAALERPAIINMDVIGIGASPYDLLVQQGIGVNGINFGAGSHARDKSGQFGFANLRAEFWWKMREALDPLDGDDLALPPDAELRADLTAPRWRPTSRGIQVESKEDVSDRIKRSPDCGDAVVLALATGADWSDAYGLSTCSKCSQKYVNPDGARRCPYCGAA